MENGWAFLKEEAMRIEILDSPLRDVVAIEVQPPFLFEHSDEFLRTMIVLAQGRNPKFVFDLRKIRSFGTDVLYVLHSFARNWRERNRSCLIHLVVTQHGKEALERTRLDDYDRIGLCFDTLEDAFDAFRLVRT